MTLKEKSTLEKLFLKVFRKNIYRKYKRVRRSYHDHVWQVNEARNLKISHQSKTFEAREAFKYANNIINSYAEMGKEINVSHSGNAGDIIYALPTLKKIHFDTGVKINLYLKVGQPLQLNYNFKHPLGKVMLNSQMVAMLAPLLAKQEYINRCLLLNDEYIDIDLDIFRNGLIMTDRGDIARWCGYCFGVNPQLEKPWITIDPLPSFKDTLVLSRSSRYQNWLVDYSFLAKYPSVTFIGVESEYLAMKRIIPKLKWAVVSDFLELARIVAGAKLFIGNQSFPFSVAEGLKVPRILEVFPLAPNVIPTGDNGYDFYLQEHLELLVSKLMATDQNTTSLSNQIDTR